MRAACTPWLADAEDVIDDLSEGKTALLFRHGDDSNRRAIG